MKFRILAFVVLAVFGGVLFYWSSSSERTDAESVALVKVSVPELSADALIGETAFNANCALCHGTNADGRDGKGPPLIHKIYEPSHHGDASFHSAALNGVRQHHWRFGNMPPVSGISPKEITSIIAYVREVQRHNGIQ